MAVKQCPQFQIPQSSFFTFAVLWHYRELKIESVYVKCSNLPLCFCKSTLYFDNLHLYLKQICFYQKPVHSYFYSAI